MKQKDLEFMLKHYYALDGVDDLEDDHDYDTEGEEFKCVRCGEVCDQDDNAGDNICSYCSQVTR